MLRALRGVRTVPCIASLALHAGALAVGSQGIAGLRAPSAAAPPPELAIELEPEVTPVPRELPEPAAEVALPARPAAAARAPRMVPHHHDYPVAPSHDGTLHDPSVVHAPVAAERPAVSESGVSADAQPPPRFAMRAVESGAFMNGSKAATTATTLTTATATSGSSNESAEFVETSVDQPARLRAAAAAAYPELARASEIEADVPLEIVVDTAGAVVSARALAAPGYGLEAAAVTTARGYRFTPARRAGRAVRVRMRCNVSFRLR